MCNATPHRIFRVTAPRFSLRNVTPTGYSLAHGHPHQFFFTCTRTPLKVFFYRATSPPQCFSLCKAPPSAPANTPSIGSLTSPVLISTSRTPSSGDQTSYHCASPPHRVLDCARTPNMVFTCARSPPQCFSLCKATFQPLQTHIA